MRRPLRRQAPPTVVTVMMLGLLASTLAPMSAGAQDEIGHVELSVLDPDGSPGRQAGFELDRRAADGTWGPARDDSWSSTEIDPGRYRLSLRDGTYRLRVADTETGEPWGSTHGSIYYPAAAEFDTASDIVVRSGETRELSTVRVPEEGTAVGQLLPPGPLEGFYPASVQRLRGSSWVYDQSVQARRRTADGHYTLGPLGAGRYRLDFSGTFAPIATNVYNARGRHPQSYWTDANPSHQTFEKAKATTFLGTPGETKQLGSVDRPENGTLSGRVLDPAGRPVEGAEVAVGDTTVDDPTSSDGGWSWGPTHRGTYRVSVDPAVSLRLGYPVEPESTTATVTMGAATKVDIRLRHARPVLTPLRLLFERSSPVGEHNFGDVAVFPTSARLSYQWFVDGKRRRAIKGATGRGFTPSASLRGRRIGLRVTATAHGRSSVVYSPGRPIVKDAAALDLPKRPFGLVDHTYRGARALTGPGVGQGDPLGIGTWQWFRDSKPIRGATDPDYTSTAADVGHRITGRFLSPSLEAPYFGKVRWTRASTRTVKTRPTMRVGARALGDGKVVLGLRAYDNHVDPKYFDGWAIFERRINGTFRQVVRIRVVDGRAQYDVAGLPPRSKQVFRIRYTPVREGHVGRVSPPFTEVVK